MSSHHFEQRHKRQLSRLWITDFSRSKNDETSKQIIEGSIIRTLYGPIKITWILRYEMLGRAIAQAVSRWLPTVAARIQTMV
jgi:hypothetical protein